MTTLQTYVRAATYRSDSGDDTRTRPTGRVLHLATFIHDPRGTALLPGTGRWLPICGGTWRHVDRWAATGVGWDGWDRHAHWPVCSHCARRLDQLANDLIAQTERNIEHADTPMRTARVDPSPPGTADLLAELRTPGAPAIPVHLTTERTNPA